MRCLVESGEKSLDETSREALDALHAKVQGSQESRGALTPETGLGVYLGFLVA